MEDEFDEELVNALIGDDNTDDDNSSNILDILPVTYQNNEGEDDEEDEDNSFQTNLYDNNSQEHEDDDVDKPHNEDVEEFSELTKNKVIDSLLKKKGIEGDLVKYENDEGEIEEINFYELPLKDQLSILETDDKDINYGLNDSEIEAVNFLRENNATFEDVIEYFKREAVKEYLDNENISGIQIDQYDDEELFAVDLKARYEDLTEEEIQIEITKQLEHPDLFKKKVDKLRTDYKQIELDQLEAAKSEKEQEETQSQEELQNTLISVAESIEDIGGLDLDNNDKNEVLSFILNKDINGSTELDKILKDPNALFNIAWYATKGKQAFDILHDYYKKQIEVASKSSYEKGKNEHTKTKTTPKGKTFVRKSSNTQKIMSIDDLKID